jgi:hypothetical protein
MTKPSLKNELVGVEDELLSRFRVNARTVGVPAHALDDDLTEYSLLLYDLTTIACPH